MSLCSGDLGELGLVLPTHKWKCLAKGRDLWYLGSTSPSLPPEGSRGLWLEPCPRQFCGCQLPGGRISQLGVGEPKVLAVGEAWFSFA